MQTSAVPVADRVSATTGASAQKDLFQIQNNGRSTPPVLSAYSIAPM
jgi:hypothetical protein